MSRLYCRGEAARFAEDEFLKIDGRLVVPHIHMTLSPHFVNGQPVKIGADPVLAYKLAERLVRLPEADRARVEHLLQKHSDVSGTEE